MDSYFASVVLIEDLKDLLVLRPIEVELVVLLHLLLILLRLLTAQVAFLHLGILVFVAYKTRAHIFHCCLSVPKVQNLLGSSTIN